MKSGWSMLASVLLLALTAGQASGAVPFWGDRESRSADTQVSQLRPGQWIWFGDAAAPGPLVMVVSLTEQRGYVYRNGVLVAATTVSTGRPGYETPTGVFTILQKDANHRSSIYDNAPMPYQERLTWGGVALHAGGLPGYPESHGCVHLPSEFARRLFEVTPMGMTVVIAKQGASQSTSVHPTMLAPVAADSGASDAIPPLEPGVPWRWAPERSPVGPVSLLLSRSDQRLVVMRNGIEIGRTRVSVAQPGLAMGTHAYVMRADFLPGDYPGYPAGRAPAWMAISLPGHEADSGQVLNPELIRNVSVPPDFLSKVYPLVVPGTVLVATDAPILPAGTGPALRVLDAEPPVPQPP